MSDNKYTLQDAVNVVCEFLEIAPIVAEKKDALDSLTIKISSEMGNSIFAQRILELSSDYSPLKIGDILNAVMIKQGIEKSQPVDDDILRSLYHIGVKQLDVILRSLSRDYCADKCDLGEIHCCSHNYHRIEFNDTKVLRLQEKEAAMSVETFTANNGCKYLSSNGCVLTISKPPFCIGYLCGPLRNHIRTIAPANAVNFVGTLNKVIDPIFDTITPERIVGFDHAIHYGKLVVEELRYGAKRYSTSVFFPENSQIL